MARLRGGRATRTSPAAPTFPGDNPLDEQSLVRSSKWRCVKPLMLRMQPFRHTNRSGAGWMCDPAVVAAVTEKSHLMRIARVDSLPATGLRARPAESVCNVVRDRCHSRDRDDQRESVAGDHVGDAAVRRVAREVALAIGGRIGDNTTRSRQPHSGREPPRLPDLNYRKTCSAGGLNTGS